MFFYLSFLRPPPCTSDTTSPLPLTPQIANDLRTAYFEESVDIYYTWAPSLSDLTGPSVMSISRKLTTWRTSSMYKSLAVPLPPNAKQHQEWWLALASSSDGDVVINLCAKDLGVRPLPVISMPVHLEVAKGAKKVKSFGKQEQIERLYAIHGSSDGAVAVTAGDKDCILCIREQTSFDLDKKIWDSGLGLGSWLARLIRSTEMPSSNALVQELKVRLVSSKSDSSLRILELGAGTGIVSVCLSALLERLSGSRHRQIFATDLPSAMELIEHNILANKSEYPSVALESLVLDWDEETLPSQVQGSLDLVVMADVTYNTASFPALVRTVESLVQVSKGCTPPPYVLLAYKQRDPAERTLWLLLRDIGVELTLLDAVEGAGEDAVEIWIWSGTPSSELC